MLEHTSLKMGITISRLFNATLATGYFPINFKHANIHLIKNKENHPPTQHPTAQLPYLTIIQISGKDHRQTLEELLGVHTPNEPTQFRFRPRRSTEDIIYTTLYYLNSYHKLNKHTALVSLDVEKVFDHVWPTNFSIAAIYQTSLRNFWPISLQIGDTSYYMETPHQENSCQKRESRSDCHSCPHYLHYPQTTRPTPFIKE